MHEKEKRPPAPAQVSTVEVAPGHYATQLRCQFPGCTETMQVELIAQGVAHPADYSESDCKDARFFVIQYLQENGRPFSTAMHLLPKDAHLYPRIELALRQGNPGALLTLRAEFVPFYCNDCDCVYCYQHMHFEEVWDEDYIIGGVDYWTGMCPYGHHEFVDH